MSQPSTLANSWQRHYEQHPMKDKSNTKLADIGDIYGHDKSINEGVAEFCNSNYLISISVAPNKRELCLIHQTNIIGGSRLDPGVTWVALLGTGATAISIEIDSAESLTQVSFIAPPWEALVTACASAASLNTLSTSAADVEVKLRGKIFLPALLADAEMNSTSKKPADLAMAFVAVLTTHDGLMEAS
jgi:hypothetical protein